MKTAREIIAGIVPTFRGIYISEGKSIDPADAILAALAAEGLSIVETAIGPESPDVRAAIDDVIPRAWKGEFRAHEAIPVEIRGMNVNQFFAAIINASRSLSRSTREAA